MSAESNGQSQRSRSLVDTRRTKAYSMYLRGYNQQQIAETLNVNQSTVSRAIAAKRQENSRWFERNEGESILRNIFQEERDRYLDLLQEEWKHYGLLETGSRESREALSLIRATVGSLSSMVGRLVKELEAVQNRKELDELKEIVRSLEKIRESTLSRTN
jgi:predicted transcriptional regulator